jgi:hypothetical protein
MENDPSDTPVPSDTPEMPQSGATPGSDTPAPEAPVSPTDQESSKPSHTRTRNGFVARLPKSLRDQINQMLLDGVPFRQILNRIGEPVAHISEDCISEWKAGGFRDWLVDLDRKEALNRTREAALDLVSEKAGLTVQDAGRTIAATQLYELLLAFNPTTFAAALSDKPELYLRLIAALARLCESEAACGHYRAKDSQLLAKRDPAKDTARGAAPKNVVTPETLKEIAGLIKLL